MADTAKRNTASYKRLTAEYKRMTAEYRRMAADYERIPAEYKRMAAEYKRMAAVYKRMTGEYKRMPAVDERVYDLDCNSNLDLCRVCSNFSGGTNDSQGKSSSHICGVATNFITRHVVSAHVCAGNAQWLGVNLRLCAAMCDAINMKATINTECFAW